MHGGRLNTDLQYGVRPRRELIRPGGSHSSSLVADDDQIEHLVGMLHFNLFEVRDEDALCLVLDDHQVLGFFDQEVSYLFVVDLEV